jgi:hypothetical protein
MKHVLKRAFNLEGPMTGMDMDGQSGNEYTWTYNEDTGPLLEEESPLGELIRPGRQPLEPHTHHRSRSAGGR